MYIVLVSLHARIVVMKELYYAHKSGFTLIEILVVVSIIVILTLGILTVLFEARKESRDLQRVSDLQQLKLAVKLFKEARGAYASSTNATGIGAGNNPIGIGGPFDTAHSPFLSKINRDPLSTGLSTGFVYVYNNNFACTKAGQAVIIARQLENPTKYRNFEAVCTAATAANKSTYRNTYIEVVNP